jgi:hypothetical protein
MCRVAELGRDRAVPLHGVYLVCGKPFLILARIIQLNQRHLGIILIFCRKTRQIVRTLRSRIGYLGNQVYYRRFHHQWLLELLDIGDQESDACKSFERNIAESAGSNLVVAISYRFWSVSR